MRALSIVQRGLLRASAVAAPFVLSGAYANTLTRLIPDLYAGLDVVSRELVGYIPSVTRDVSAERAALGQSIVYFVTPPGQMVDVTPQMNIPEPPDTVIGNGIISISKSKAVPFGFTGEEQRGLNSGSGYLSVQADLFAQALRTLTNAIEADLAAEAAANVSRFYGTAGTTPFATTVGDAAQVRKILDDNGAPLTGRSMVIDTTAGANLRSLSNLTKANEAGSTMTLSDGTLINLAGLNIKESAQVVSVGAGTAAGSTTTAAGFAKGATTIAIAAAGTGTIPAGTSIKFAGDNNVYTIAPGGGLASAAAGGSITLNAPGLRVAIPASATAITVVAAHVVNTAFSPNALRLVARAPALPNEGDLAIDRMNIIDPRCGMVFEVAIYAGYRKVRAEVAQAWGVKAIKPEHISGLLG